MATTATRIVPDPKEKGQKQTTALATVDKGTLKSATVSSVMYGSSMHLRRHDLWSGWSIGVPEGCAVSHEPGGPWSAWDERHVLDVHIVDVGGGPSGRPLSPEEMLGDAPGEPIALTGAVGRAWEDTEVLHPAPVEWTHLHAAAQNTLLMLSVGNAAPRDTHWHRTVLAGIEHSTEVDPG